MVGRLGLWRHLLVLLAVGLVSVLALLGAVGAGNHPERFDAKQVTITRVGDNGLRIREVVDEDFGNARRHGYERIILNDFGVPAEVTASSPNANADINVASTYIGTNAATRIRLGDPETTYQNQHRYELSYTLPDADLSSGRLHLDVIGSGEELETGRFDVIVSGLVLQDAVCNVGSEGAVGGCDLEVDGDVYRATFRPLAAGDGITLDARVTAFSTPVQPAVPPLPTYRTDRRATLALALIPIGLAAAVAVFVIAKLRGRNEVFSGGPAEAAYGARAGAFSLPPGAALPEAPPVSLVTDAELAALATTEFVPPRGVDPWQASVLLRERIDDETVAAWFSALVASEAITLREDGRKLVVGIGRRRSELDPSNAALVNQFMNGRLEITLGSYDPAFAAAWSSIKAQQGASIQASGWWKRRAPRPDQSPSSNPLSFIVIVVVILFVLGGSLASALFGIMRGVPAALAFGVLVPGFVAYCVYATLLPVRSATGSSLTLLTESFRRFLIASEGRHVEWAWQQGLLREYSAWAVALGAADAWGRALSRSNVPRQEYIASSPLLVHSMHTSFASSHTAPSSSGSGGGGGGGGGVGGGGGGGSSGSW